MLNTLIARLGSDVEAAIDRAAEDAGGPPLSAPHEMRWDGHAGMVWDPTLTETGFLLQITAPTDEGWLEASFNARGELRRGLIGDRLVDDADTLIRRWRHAVGEPPAVALGLSDY